MICCSIARKWIISLLGIYSCALMFAQRAALSVSMVRMTSDATNTTVDTAPRFDWDETLQGVILGSSFYVYWIVPTIAGSLTESYGGKWLAFIGVLVPGILMAITPWAATMGVGLLIAVQVLTGAAQGFTYPSLFYLYVQWFPPHERSKANSGIQVGVSLGSTIIYLVGGYLCQTHLGWPMVFYVGAAFHLPWLFLWLYFAADKPPVEYDTEKPMSEKPKMKKKVNVPWFRILTSPVVWSSIITKCVGSYGFFMFLSKVPAYLDMVYKVNIVENGAINAAAEFSYGFMCFLAPYLSNYLIDNHYLSGLRTRKLFQIITALTPAICMLTITQIDNNQKAVIALLILSMFGYGFVTGGEWTMISDFAPNFVGAVSGITLALGFMTGIFAPYIVGIILDSDIGTLKFKWNVVFYMTSSFYVFGLSIFLLFATDQQQEWDKINQQ